MLILKKVLTKYLTEFSCTLEIRYQGTLFEILKSYLKDQKHCFRIIGQYSDEADVTSGVPQASKLGPLLFVIYVNDIAEMFISLCKLFADDLKYIFYQSIGLGRRCSSIKKMVQ